MSTKKSAGSSKNLRDSQPKFLGVKRADGQAVNVGQVLVRQRGTKIEAGKNVKVGTDHTLYAMSAGKVAFRTMRKTRFDGRTVVKKVVHVVAA
jgi:large subunit ribosomal protein L27